MPKAYQQSGPYVPRKDADLNSWLAVFARHVANDPGKYGLSGQDAQILMGLSKEFTKLYDLVQSAQMRTPGLITQKDAIRASAIGTFRTYAAQIRANKGVTNDDKLALGLHIPDPTRARIGRPESAPMLTIPGLFNGCHVLRYADEHTPNSRRKPRGIDNMQLWMAVAEKPVTDPSKAELVGIYTTCPITVHHEMANAGKTASYFGRWVTKRGLMGPWSLPIWMQIAFGGGRADEQVKQPKQAEPLKMAA